jgi:cytochrome c-type biogenesis protein CcmH/NrfG
MILPMALLLWLLLGDCAACGAHLRDEAKYCTQCGTRVAGPAAEAGELLAAGKPEEAVRAANRAIQEDPRNAQAWYLRGRAHTALGRRVEALRDLDRAVELDPTRKEYLLARGRTRLRDADAEECRASIEDFARALRLDSRNIDARVGRSEALYRLALLTNDESLLNAALLYIEEALELDRSIPRHWILLGEIRTSRRDFARATEALDQAIRLEPSADAYLARARSQMLLRSYEKALEDAAEAARRAPSDPRARILLGDIRIGLRSISEAIEEYSAALRLDPSHFDAWLHRGQARLLLDSDIERARSITDLTRALSIRANDVAALLARGRAYFALRDFDAAAGDWRRVLELRPDLRTEVQPLLEEARRKGRP